MFLLSRYIFFLILAFFNRRIRDPFFQGSGGGLLSDKYKSFAKKYNLNYYGRPINNFKISKESFLHIGIYPVLTDYINGVWETLDLSIYNYGFASSFQKGQRWEFIVVEFKIDKHLPNILICPDSISSQLQKRRFRLIKHMNLEFNKRYNIYIPEEAGTAVGIALFQSISFEFTDLVSKFKDTWLIFELTEDTIRGAMCEPDYFDMFGGFEKFCKDLIDYLYLIVKNLKVAEKK